MRELKIAVANTRKAKTWNNRVTTWGAFVERLSTTQKTIETIEEFLAMKRGEQDEIKDVGGYVMGHLKQGKRRAGSVLCRSCVTLDMDFATPGIMEHVRKKLPYKGCAYGTHKYTPDKPRLRQVYPLSRDVTEEEYEPIARMLAKLVGMDYFDDSTYEANRLMYWPSTPSNVEYYFEAWDGELVDPDKILAMYDDWRDISTWPTSSRQSAVMKQTIKRQADPLTKDGIVGVFCRTYDIREVIEHFLSDLYEPSAMEGRYDYIPGEGSAGVQIFDDKFVFSHHATDPAYGKLLNGFDLVRVHRFEEDDSAASFKAMAEFATSQDEVKQTIASEREEAARMDFGDDDWKMHLRYGRNEGLENSVWNLLLILRNDPAYANFAYNEMARMIEVTGPVTWERPDGNRYWLDSDTDGLKSELDIHYTCFSTRNHDVAFSRVAMERRFNPLRDYLDGLPAWDGVERIPELLIRYMKADDTEYVRTVTKKTFTAAVARIYQPGIKFDCMLVLDGEQGIGKSTLFKELAGEEYFSDSLQLSDMDSKAAAEKIQGFWICEIAELAGMKKADIEKVKSFLSSSDDKFRPSYGKTVESHPRQGIMVASVNGDRGYLRDITGNRRFWVVKLHQTEQVKTFEFSEEDRDQIWAEAKYYFQAGEKLYLEGALVEDAAEVQRDAMEEDERQGMVEVYLEALLPENWNDMDLYARRAYLHNIDDPTITRGSVRRETVSNVEIWCECYCKPLSDLKPSDSYAIMALMEKVDGWKRSKTRKRMPIYGQQRVYVRD
ncbi:MAG: virulence-associated E family protein [Lachnospiraceae bacterium]|nr:virulence-associated E family protein [Lachnospiraceae bacterium]